MGFNLHMNPFCYNKAGLWIEVWRERVIQVSPFHHSSLSSCHFAHHVLVQLVRYKLFEFFCVIHTNLTCYSRLFHPTPVHHLSLLMSSLLSLYLPPASPPFIGSFCAHTYRRQLSVTASTSIIHLPACICPDDYLVAYSLPCDCLVGLVSSVQTNTLQTLTTLSYWHHFWNDQVDWHSLEHGKCTYSHGNEIPQDRMYVKV